MAVTVVLSLSAALGGRYVENLFGALALRPAAVWRGQLWRLVTWTFAEPSPFGLIFACLSLYWFGAPLARQWGSYRFLRMVGGVILAAAVGTCLIALIDGEVRGASYLGSWTLTVALVVVWGLTFPHQTVNIYFVLPIRGYWLAWGTVGITVLVLIYYGWMALVPELLAECAALLWFFRPRVLARWAAAQRPWRDPVSRKPRERGVVVDFSTGDRVKGKDSEPN
jgi:membrane associated rhomboid family serine protease